MGKRNYQHVQGMGEKSPLPTDPTFQPGCVAAPLPWEEEEEVERGRGAEMKGGEEEGRRRWRVEVLLVGRQFHAAAFQEAHHPSPSVAG